MKNLLLPAVLFLSINCIAQVGINTANPDKDSDLTLASDNKGLLLNKVQLVNTTSPAPLSLHVAGMTVYNTSSTGDVVPGIYYNDGVKWTRTSQNEPWSVQNTANQAVSNTENIYQQGKVAVGFTNSDVLSDKQFEVKGNIKSLAKITNPGNGEETYHLLETGLQDNSFFAVSNSQDFGSSTQNAFLNIRKEVIGLTTNLDDSHSGVVVTAKSLGVSTSILPDQISSLDLGTQIDGSIGAHLSDTNSSVTSDLNISYDKGIEFKFISGTNILGQYIFPKNNGTSNQVLVSDGITPSAQLSWKNISDLPTSNLLKSPNGNCFKLSVDNTGALSTAPTACP